MSYSMLTPGLSPEEFGSGMAGGLGGLLGRWGDSTQRGLYSGMKLGTALSNYGTSQRLAGQRETNERQRLNTDLVGNQNKQLDAQTAQQTAMCDRIGWGSDQCQAFKAMLEGQSLGRVPAFNGQAGVAGGQAIGAQGTLRGFDNAFSPSSVLGTDVGYDTYDAYDNQGGY